MTAQSYDQVKEELLKSVSNALDSSFVKDYLGEEGLEKLNRLKFVIDLTKVESDDTIQVCLTETVDFEPPLSERQSILPALCHFFGSKVRCCGFSEIEGENSQNNSRIWVMTEPVSPNP